MGDPFQPPGDASAADAPPKVWVWYLGYCGAMVVLYALIMLVCFAVPFLGDLAESDQEAAVMMVLLPVMGFVCLVLVVLYALPFALGRSPGGYNLGFATIGLGLTGGLTMIPAVILLIGWLDTKNRAGLRGEG